MHNIVTFHSYDYLVDFQCFQHIFLNISSLTQWILLNLFVLSSHYSIHSFYLFRFFLPCSGMSQQVNFAFSDISSLFYYITSNSYCKCTIFGTHIVDIITHVRSKMWTYQNTERLCTLKLKSHASKQPCSKYFSYSAHSLHIYIPTDSDF